MATQFLDTEEFLELDTTDPDFSSGDSSFDLDFGTQPSKGLLKTPDSAAPRIQEAQSFELESFGDVSRTQEPSFELDRKSAAQKKSAAIGLGLGLQIGGAPTGSEDLVSPESIIQVLGSAGAGFLVGGPVGAVAGGLAAGLQVFLSTRATKKANKAQAAKEVRYQKMVKEQLAREEKFRKQERFDKLEQVGYNRTQDKMEQNWSAYKDFSGQIMSAINNNAKLKQRFAKEGF